jgi:hypothetical protein
MITKKKKICKDCGAETYIFSKGLCKACSVRSKALLSKSSGTVHSGGDRLKLGGMQKLKIDFTMPYSELEKLSLSSLKRVCDFWFRKYLLYRAERDLSGRVYCAITERYLPEDDVHVCHYLDRQIMSLRYSEDNCILCSAFSNSFESTVPDETKEFKSLHHRKFAAALIKKDKEKIKNLELLSEKIVRYTKDDYLRMITKFRGDGN